MQPVKQIKIYWELLRGFTLFAPFIGILSGAAIAVFANDIPINAPLFFRILIIASAAALLNGASNSLNQYYDVGIDQINKPERPIPSGKISKDKTLRIAIICYVISLFVVPIASDNPLQTFVLFLAAAVLTIIYSAPPIRTKRFTWLSSLTIAFARGLLLIVAGWSVVSSAFVPEPWLLGMSFGILILFLAPTKDLDDIEGDKKFRINTVPITFGGNFTRKYIATGFVVPFIFLLILSFTGLLVVKTFYLASLSIFLLSWGVIIAYLLNKNMISGKRLWRQMYFIMMAFQVGLVIAYFLS